MKKILLAGLLISILAGCGKSEAEEDFERCSEEWAEGSECSRKEFEEFLMFELEDSAFLIGGLENATAENQAEWIGEVNDKVEEIFGEGE